MSVPLDQSDMKYCWLLKAKAKAEAARMKKFEEDMARKSKSVPMVSRDMAGSKRSISPR